jgi:membrane protease YdiL (CAAX protease family)
MVVAAPVFEELFFRGFLLAGFQRTILGTAGAVVVTSLLWAVIHTQYDLYYMATIFVRGVVLGLARVHSGSLILPIGLHAFVNGLATMQTAYLVF